MRTFLLFLSLQLMAINGYKLFSGSTKTPIIVGSTKPIENFDPLNLSKDESRVPFFREAELKHGRIAMVASTIIPITESITHKPAIFEFQHLANNIQLGIVSLMFISEFGSMLRGWENPFSKPFTLSSDYQPGDLGFSTGKLDESFLNKELNNGRLAMIGTLGIISQELITQQPIF